MNWIKKHWSILVIIFLVLFCFNKCVVSCNRGNKISKFEQTINNKDSIINSDKHTIDSLSHIIDIYKERESGLKNSLQITDNALNKISETKKNISVTVKQKR